MLLQILGIHLDPKITLKYEKILSDQKFTYTKFFASLESVMDPCIEDSMMKSLAMVEELGFYQLSPTRITLKMQSILFYFMRQDQESISKGTQELNEILAFFKKHQNTYDFCKQRLLQCYSKLLQLSLDLDDANTYLKYAEDYLLLGIKYCVNSEILHSHFISYIPALVNRNQLDEALRISQMHIEYLQHSTSSKLYFEALKYHILVLKSMSSTEKLTKTILEYQVVAEKIYTKISPEYLDAKIRYIYLLNVLDQLNQAYKEGLEAYDIAKEVYGSEKNNDSVDTLTIMAIIKARFGQYDDAQNFINKCKKIEEQISSVYSERYKYIIDIEQRILQSQKVEKSKASSKERGWKKRITLSKIAPNTPLKIGVYSAFALAIDSLAYWYYKKDKN